MEAIDNKSGMTPEEIVSEISFQKSAIYKIIVQGELSQRYSEILGGMQLNILREKGKRPVNAQISYYVNIVKPDNGPDGQLRAQFALLFPQ